MGANSRLGAYSNKYGICYFPCNIFSLEISLQDILLWNHPYPPSLKMKMVEVRSCCTDDSHLSIINSAKRRCNVGTILELFKIMSQQYCNALLRWKSTLQIVPLAWEAVERIVWRRGWEWGVVWLFTVMTMIMTMIMKKVFSMYVGANCRWVPLAKKKNNVSVLQAQRFS